MGPAFREVLQDLWWFALRREPLEDLSTAQSPRTAESVRESTNAIPQQSVATLDSGRVAYVLRQDTPCFARPNREFDSRVGMLGYGESVFVEVIEGGFARVRTTHVSGWVPHEHLSNDRADADPHFVADTTYGADHPETQKLRAHLQDALDGSSLRLPLQPTEYVLYRLQSLGINLDWPDDRPRLPGHWQNLLRGHPRVRMGVEPKTNAVIECGGSRVVPRLGVVETVGPDGTITCTYVDPQSPGTFRHQSLAVAAWRELRPIFLSFV